MRKPSITTRRLAKRLDRPGYPWYVRALDRMTGLLRLVGLMLVGCGSWTSTDAQNATDATNLSVQMEVICGREDAGATCVPAAVRAMERASYCATGSMLARHGAVVPDAGIACVAP